MTKRLDEGDDRDGTRYVRVGKGDGGGAGGGSIRQMKISNVLDDVITCHGYDGDESSEDSFTVARPYLLRREPFDGKNRGGISYAYSSHSARVATQNLVTETQVIVPRYLAGDIIYAAKPISGGTSVTSNGKKAKWLDINADGRAWARVNDGAV